MKAIFKREWRSYFYSPIGYIFAGVFIALCSFFFVNGALRYQSGDISIVFSNINIIYLFLVSILTMGLLSTERSRRTDQLLLTSPVSVSKIVVGKYLAALGVFGTTLLLSLIYPIILQIFGNPATSELIGAYIGFILLWGAFIAIGLFISALTESQMIAAIITFGVLLIVFYMNTLAANIGNETVKNIVLWFSLMDRYTEFETGILNIVNVVYYLSFVVAFLFLSVQVIKRRQSSDKKVRANNMVVTAAGIAAIILINAIVSTVGAKLPMKIDFTRDSVYEYSEQTYEVLDAVTEDIDVYALYPESADGELIETMREYLEQYENMNSKIKVSYVDPYEDPAFIRKYGENISVGSVIVQKGDRFRIIPIEKLYLQGGMAGNSVSIDAEKQLTSAIRYVSGMGQEVKAYFTKGHNEYAGLDSALASELENEGYTVGEISIAMDGIPEDADLIITLDPSADFTQEEKDALDAYVLGGGNVAFAFSAGALPMERLYSFLSEWGITVNRDFVIENDSSRAFRLQSGMPIPAPQMLEHSITEKLIGGDVEFIAPVSCSFTLNENNPQYATVTPLLVTTEDSWGIIDMNSTSFEKKEEDISGPLTLAATATKGGEGSGRLFVLGSVEAIEMQGIMNNSSYSNGDFILNALSYLTDKGDALNIRAKVISADMLNMTEQQISISGIILQYIIPLLVIAAGLLVWLRRRYL